jgi:hypothetical protein
MALSDWTELEVLSRKITNAQSRLAAARSTQNHGLVTLLEPEIADAEILRDRMVSQLAARITSEPRSVIRGGPAHAGSDPVLPEPAPSPEPFEGAVIVWNQLSRADIERVKRELDQRRSEMLARHAEELKALEGDQAEIDILEQAIDSLARKFNLGGAKVVSLDRAVSQAG